MLGAGPDLLRQPTAPYTAEAEAEVLAQALARRPGGLPLLVANPDEIRPDGNDSPMPGQLARRYRELGAADVRLVGKPHPLIYKVHVCKPSPAPPPTPFTLVLALTLHPTKPHPLICKACNRKLEASGLPSHRVAAVGDSLHHDVLGAHRNGIDSVLICSGVHSTELGIPQAQAVPPAPERLAALVDDFVAEHGNGSRPTHIITAFRS